VIELELLGRRALLLERFVLMADSVVIDDNFHFMEEDGRITGCEYETLDGAIEVCKKIVDRYLRSAYSFGMTAKALYSNQPSFGEDPWISGAVGRPFSGWKRIASLGRPAAQEGIKALMGRGFHKPGDVENRLGYYLGQIAR
jgi:hypothetical protein